MKNYIIYYCREGGRPCGMQVTAGSEDEARKQAAERLGWDFEIVKIFLKK